MIIMLLILTLHTDNVLGKLNAYITDIDNCINYMRLIQEPRLIAR